MGPSPGCGTWLVSFPGPALRQPHCDLPSPQNSLACAPGGVRPLARAPAFRLSLLLRQQVREHRSLPFLWERRKSLSEAS